MKRSPIGRKIESLWVKVKVPYPWRGIWWVHISLSKAVEPVGGYITEYTWRMTSVTPDLRLLSQPQSVTALWPVGLPLYCLVNRGTRVWTTCPGFLPSSALGDSRTSNLAVVSPTLPLDHQAIPVYAAGSYMLNMTEFASLRAQVRSASAVLILANRCAASDDEEDAANIMRATAIKNFRQNTRIIIQLLQYRNKVACSARMLVITSH